MNFLLRHPRSVCLTYFEHFRFSMSLARRFFVASLKAIVHAFIPCYYITSSTDIIQELQEDMKKIGCRD